MHRLKKLMLRSVSLLFLVILFNIFGYFYIAHKTAQYKVVEQAETLVNSQQVYIQQLCRSITSLSIHHFLSPEQYLTQQGTLRESLGIFERERRELDALTRQGDYPRQDSVRSLFGSAESSYAPIGTFGNSLLRAGTIQNKTDYSNQTMLRQQEASYLKNMQSIENAFLGIGRDLQADITVMNRVMIISLVSALVILTVLVVAPVFRQSMRNHKELQASLEKVKKSEALLRTIIDASPDMVFILDNEGRYQMVNEAAARHFDMPAEQFIGKKNEELEARVETIPAGALSDTIRIMEDAERIYLPEVNLHVNGKRNFVSVQKVPLLDESAQVWGILGFVHDITERIVAERRIIESEQQYRHLFELNPMPMWIYDEETLGFLEVNRMAIQHYGYTEEEFESMTIFDIRPEQERHRLQCLIGNEKDENVAYKHGVWTHLKKSGEAIFVEIISHRINYHGKRATLILSKDVTRNIELQNQLLEEKIARQREIARSTITVQEKERSEIAKELHDNVNQILTTVKLHLDFMGSPEADQEKHRANSLMLVTAAIQEIRRLSKSLVPRSLDDVGLVSSIDDLVHNINSLQSIELSFSHEDFDEAGLDAGLKLSILRIIQEQTTNIIKYAEATAATIRLTFVDGAVHLSISDNGVGFDTSHPSQGIGFSNIINRADIYKGKVDILSEPGEGCQVQVSFVVDDGTPVRTTHPVERL
jgi:PAS domain S-box-containing protein